MPKNDCSFVATSVANALAELGRVHLPGRVRRAAEAQLLELEVNAERVIVVDLYYAKSEEDLDLPIVRQLRVARP